MTVVSLDFDGQRSGGGDLDDLAEHLVKTSFYSGLGDEHVEEAVALLAAGPTGGS